MISGRFKKEKLTAMSTLRRQWLLAWGGVTAVVVADAFLDGFWTAVVCLTVGIALDRTSIHRQGKINPCVRLMSLAGSVLITAAAIMTLIVALNKATGAAVGIVPFISSLIIYPTALIFFGVSRLRHGNTRYCTGCPMNRCDVSCLFMTKGLIHRETRFQLTMSIGMAGVTGLITWIYYFAAYINVNISSSDIVFFVGIPAAFFIVSVMAYTTRCRDINELIAQIDTSDVFVSANHSKIRFLIIRDDKLLLVPVGKDKQQMDTPAILNIDYSDSYDDESVRHEFAKLVDRDDFYLKRLYVTIGSSPRSNTYHYGVTIDRDSAIDVQGVWLTLDQVDRLWRQGQLTMSLIGEIHRVFSVTMAWKTYDAHGRRLYPIKNYRPTFRLADFKDWDVDYNDPKWLRIAVDNEDRPMWAIRRFIRRLIGSKN